jgi:hypothetical protein
LATLVAYVAPHQRASARFVRRLCKTRMSGLLRVPDRVYLLLAQRRLGMESCWSFQFQNRVLAPLGTCNRAAALRRCDRARSGRRRRLPSDPSDQAVDPVLTRSVVSAANDCNPDGGPIHPRLVGDLASMSRADPTASTSRRELPYGSVTNRRRNARADGVSSRYFASLATHLWSPPCVTIPTATSVPPTLR